MPRRKPAKATESPVSERNEPEGSNVPDAYGADGYVDGSPFFNKRLPWLEGAEPCGLHDPFKDTKTGYAYCRTCGFSFGLV